MEYSLFTEALIDHEAAATQMRTAVLRQAIAEEVFPFLALAANDEDYRHRKALAWEVMGAVAVRHDASFDETEAVADRMYALWQEAKTAQAVKTAAKAPCANCDHSNTDHTEGLTCSCGCSNYQPTTAGEKEARLVTAEGEGEGPF